MPAERLNPARGQSSAVPLPSAGRYQGRTAFAHSGRRSESRTSEPPSKRATKRYGASVRSLSSRTANDAAAIAPGRFARVRAYLASIFSAGTSWPLRELTLSWTRARLSSGAADPDEEKPYVIALAAGVAQHRDFRTDGVREDGLGHEGAVKHDAREALLVRDAPGRPVRRELCEPSRDNPGSGSQLVCNAIRVDERKPERGQVGVVKRRLARSIGSGEEDEQRRREVRAAEKLGQRTELVRHLP